MDLRNYLVQTLYYLNHHQKHCLYQILCLVEAKQVQLATAQLGYKRKLIKFYISKETLNRTNFKSLIKGDLINLEKSLKFGDRISGHFVQGHVDTTSTVKKINFVGKSWFVNFKLAKKYKKYLIQKGSITINGISLTVSKILADGFQIVIIPHTLKLTNLVYLKEKDVVNVEFDVLGKYIKSVLK